MKLGVYYSDICGPNGSFIVVHKDGHDDGFPWSPHQYCKFGYDYWDGVCGKMSVSQSKLGLKLFMKRYKHKFICDYV